jgi:pimeloyl-ACP methyl ester carboxylesterase
MLQQGFSPRSWQGDLAVALADALARKGILTVRMDLPGLGDSEGDLPEDFLTLIETIQEGGLAEVACECLDRLKSQLGLRRVVLGGHCGGAITDFFAVTSRADSQPIGMFALDTAFQLVYAAQPVHAAQSAATSVGRPVAQETWSLRREVLRQEIRTALLSTRLGGPLQKAAQEIRNILRPMRSDRRLSPGQPSPEGKGLAPDPAQLPPQANLRLLECIQKVLRSGMPLLFVDAYDPAKPSEFNFLEYILSSCPGRASHKRIFGTNHGFIAADGKFKLIECVTEWVTREFRDPNHDHPARHGN